MTLLLYAAAALCEIAGGFAVWAWWREGRSPLWLLPATALLLLFAVLLARAPTAFAAYGGACVAASLLWLWAVEGERPDRCAGTSGAASSCWRARPLSCGCRAGPEARR